MFTIPILSSYVEYRINNISNDSLQTSISNPLLDNFSDVIVIHYRKNYGNLYVLGQYQVLEVIIRIKNASNDFL